MPHIAIEAMHSVPVSIKHRVRKFPLPWASCHSPCILPQLVISRAFECDSDSIVTGYEYGFAVVVDTGVEIGDCDSLVGVVGSQVVKEGGGGGVSGCLEDNVSSVFDEVPLGWAILKSDEEHCMNSDRRYLRERRDELHS
jgi:hypothetical protein